MQPFKVNLKELRSHVQECLGAEDVLDQTEGLGVIDEMLPNTWFNVLLVFYIRSLMNRINKKSYSLSEPIPAPKLARVELYAWTGLLCQWNHRPAFLDGGKGKDVPKGWTWGSDELRSGVWKIDQTGNILIPSWVWQEDMQTHGLLSPSSIVVANQSQI